MSVLPLHNTISSDRSYEYHSQLSIDSAQPAHAFDVYDLEEFAPPHNKPFWAAPWDMVVGQGFALVDNFMQQQDIHVEKGTLISVNRGPIQRMKYLIAMVGLIAIACIFFLGQISNQVSLPPSLTNDLVTVVAPAAQPVVSAPVASGGSSLISPIFAPEVQRWESLIVSYANQFGVDPNAVATVMQIESCGDPYAESHAGAQGLFQVMPFHFEAHEDMKDPATNANRGVAYLALGIDITNGDIGRAMAGYNGGHSIANKDSSQWYNETQRYYYWGTGIYADAVAGRSSSERLQEWMQAGGASLCSQAAGRDIGDSGILIDVEMGTPQRIETPQRGRLYKIRIIRRDAPLGRLFSFICRNSATVELIVCNGLVLLVVFGDFRPKLPKIPLNCKASPK